jgi:thiol-disulfide isomerase/thioredoxin
LVAIAVIILSGALFIGIRTQNTTISLKTALAAATPYEVSLNNGKPTIIEFYAEWCASCQAMAPDVFAIEKQYGQQFNLVMLNVDNNKWLPEVTKYEVDGIPRFLFFNQNKEIVGDATGIIPRNVLAQNAEALIHQTKLPYASLTSSQVSNFSAPQPADTTQPRDHA